jgi:hypothetical protein
LKGPRHKVRRCRGPPAGKGTAYARHHRDRVVDKPAEADEPPVTVTVPSDDAALWSIWLAVMPPSLAVWNAG